MKANFFAELKRRNVYKVAIAYAVVGWLLIQIATQVFPFFEIPNWGVRLMVLIIALGFPIALILAWAFELTPEGIKRDGDGGNEGRSSAIASESRGFMLSSLLGRSRRVCFFSDTTAASKARLVKRQ